MPTADEQGAPNVIDRVREQEAASPQGGRTVTTSTVAHIEAVPLSSYSPADLRDDDDNSSSSEAADIELWMTARRLTPERPDEERYVFRPHPNVVEELFEAEEAADREERRGQMARLGRSFSES